MGHATETDVADAAKHLRSLDQGLNQILFEQQEIIEGVITGILARGHSLLEGLPGLGKTQFALFGAMQERRVTVLGKTHDLPLPEAQLDRFLWLFLWIPPVLFALGEMGRNVEAVLVASVAMTLILFGILIVLALANYRKSVIEIEKSIKP
jgi:MoxR-like ATPase